MAYDREKHSQPRKTIITQMSTNYPQESAEFIRRKIASDNSYVVQAEMIKQLGRVGGSSDISLIKKLSKEWSPRHIIRKASKIAIPMLKGE